MILTLAGSWLVLTVMTQPLPAMGRRTAKQQAATANEKTPVLKVEGRWHATEADAWRSAETQARLELIKHFRQQGLALERAPRVEDLRPMLTGALSKKPDPEEKFFEGVGLMQRYVIELPVTPAMRSYLIQQDRQQRSQERMIWLGKILAGLVVLLAAAACYFRLDEWTKGYYTTWLRVGTAGFIGASIFLLFRFA
jgi:hypothetical protein